MYNRNKVFAAACTGLFLFGMTLITLGSILPELEAIYAAEQLNTGLLASVLPAGILLGSLVFGPIVDRYGYKMLLIVSVLISAIALEGLAYSHEVSLLYVFIFLIGFGGGIINGVTSALVADISSKNKGASLSLLGVSYGVGALGMPLLLGILSKTLSYNTILASVGFFMILPIVFFILTKFPAPRQAQGFPLKAGIKLLKEPMLMLTSFFLFFQSAVEMLVNNWTTSYLQHELSISNEKGKYALSFMLGGLTLTRLLLGGLLKKVSSFALMFVSLLVVAAGSLILLSTHSYNMAFVALVMIGAGLAGGFPVILGYIGQLYAQLSGTAFSIALVIGLTGNILINYFFGRIVSTYNAGYMPYAVLACIACMLVIFLVIRNRISSKVK